MSEVLNGLFRDVDWMGISEKDINQIKYEVKHWYDDYSKLQELRELAGEDIGESFEDKFNRWIVDRIKMVVSRETF